MTNWISKLWKAAGAAMIGAMAFVALPGTAQAAAGLNGSYYTFSSGPSSISGTLASIASASNPTATFTATTICYPSCGGVSNDGVGLTNWLGNNATNFSASVANVTALNNHGLDLTGYIYIANSGTQTFMTGSDDGSALWIDGTMVVNNDGLHGYATQTGTISLNQGWYSIRIVQFENGGDTALTAMLNGNALTSSILSTTSAVPEPATWGLMIIGFGAMGVAMRRQRKAGALRI